MGSGPSKQQKHGSRAKKWRNNKPGISSRSRSIPDEMKKKTAEQAIPRAMTDGTLPLETSTEQKMDSSVLNPENLNGAATLGVGLTAEPAENNGDVNDNGIVFCTPITTRKVSTMASTASEYQNVLTPSELYNLITAETWQGYPQIHDSAYLLLLDCRDRETYEESHIVTARHHSALYSEYGLLLPRQLKLFNIIVLYSYSNSCQKLMEFSRKLAEDKIDHYLLQCGASDFLSLFPFLGSTQTNSFMVEMRNTLQTMPSEIIPGRLYQGNAKHALDSYIIKSLGITHIVNVTLEHPNRFEDTVKYLRIQLDDKPHVDLRAWLPKTTEFMHSAIGPCTIDFSDTTYFKNLGEAANGVTNSDAASPAHDRPGAVLVHCNLGRSRSSTVVLAYLMQVHKLTLGLASRLLKDCRSTVRPNVGFLDQLLGYEKEVFGKAVTSLNDLPF